MSVAGDGVISTHCFIIEKVLKKEQIFGIHKIYKLFNISHL